MKTDRAKKGSIEVIVGCMSSGKSEELIRRMRRASIAKLGTIVFKPAHDTRSDALSIVSRDGMTHRAIAVACSGDILLHVNGSHRVVGIDETQFFDADIVRVADRLVENGIRVIIVGLDTDFRGEPFGVMPQLLAVADSVTKLQAVCVMCGEPAVRSQLTVTRPSEDLNSSEFVGGDEKYEARCRDCHVVPT